MSLNRLLCICLTTSILAACGEEFDPSDSPPPNPAGADAGVPDAGESSGSEPDAGSLPDFVAGCAPAEAPQVIASDAESVSVQTAHYTLIAETEQEKALLFIRLLEASYEALKNHFEAEPALNANQRLTVRFLASKERFLAQLRADGLPELGGDVGGYYSPMTRTAYLYRQGNPYNTRTLLLHEALHQFHYLARNPTGSMPFWYVEGVAEDLSRHDWDGNCIRLGIVPLLSWEDLPKDALQQTEPTSFDVTPFVDGTRSASRAVAWALHRYLRLSPTHRDPFRTLQAEIEGGTATVQTFSSLIAVPAALNTPLRTWVAANQEPMEPIFTEWIPTSSRGVYGFAETWLSGALVKGNVTHFEASYDVPLSTRWDVGLMLAYQDHSNFFALLLGSAGNVWTFKVQGGQASTAWVTNAPASTGDGEGTISVDFNGSQAEVTVNATKATLTLPFPARGGVALNQTEVQFRALDWQ
jgi:hypothetical protein